MKIVIGVFIGLVSIVYHYVSSIAHPRLRFFPPPPVTLWKPIGRRHVAMEPHANYSIVPFPDKFHTFHGNLHNDDSVWTVAAPMFELDWVAEPDMFIVEGPTFDNYDNLYFTPLNPTEDVSLVCLDTTTGRRKWTLPGRGPSWGAPLVLNDPTDPLNHRRIGGGRQIIYHSTDKDSYAIKADSGDILWHTTPNFQSIRPRGSKENHQWGLNYHPTSDTIIGVLMNGEVFALDRTTGKPVTTTFQLPCSPAMPSTSAQPPRWLVDRGNRETDLSFGKLPSGESIYESILEVIFGSDACVSNFFAIDQNTGNIFIAATAPDAHDGTRDGISEFGALYCLTLVEVPTDSHDYPYYYPYRYRFHLKNTTSFHGGTGTTPSMSANGKVIYISDDEGTVFAIDSNNFETLWSVNVGEQVAASLAISADNHEIYVITETNIIKIKEQYHLGMDLPHSAIIVWYATLDAYPDFININTLTPTITANGIAISMAAAITVNGKTLPINNGMGLLDRETGKLRYYAEGRDDSIAATAVDRRGALYHAHSPIRRAATRAIFGDLVKPLVGGIARYKPIHAELLVRDAVCAASARIDNLVSNSAQFSDDLAQVYGLVQQAWQTNSTLVNHALLVLIVTIWENSVVNDTSFNELQSSLKLLCNQLTI